MVRNCDSSIRETASCGVLEVLSFTYPASGSAVSFIGPPSPVPYPPSTAPPGHVGGIHGGGRGLGTGVLTVAGVEDDCRATWMLLVSGCEPFFQEFCRTRDAAPPLGVSAVLGVARWSWRFGGLLRPA